ncbi:MAG TPA: sulfite exporter TauE/SafE family protein [Candidatus Acidoferrales bacterium]|nr:sulfite exporter TauE/SafE family protein [Candidatus Acidoferrales bacterium]
MTLSQHLFLFFAALVAGAVNSVAGGGSFISFPALLFTGMAPIAANATNTVALFPGTMASTVAYRNAFGPESRRFLLPLVVTGVIGGVLGARILLGTPQQTFLRLVPWLLLLATLLFVFSGRMTAWVRSRAGHHPSPVPGEAPGVARIPRTLVAVVLFLELIVSIYVGYFGAGSGILMLSLLALLGIENIHAMNGMKTLLVSVVNGVAAVTFILARVIVWPQALLMLVGAAAGGYGGAYLAQKMNPQHVRWLVIAIGFAMSAYFFIKY